MTDAGQKQILDFQDYLNSQTCPQRLLNQNYWNQGLLTEALKVLTEFSFEQFGLKKLILLIDKENVPSKKVALKSGYHLVRKFKGTNQYSKKIRDFEQYELRKSDDEIYQKNSEIGEI